MVNLEVRNFTVLGRRARIRFPAAMLLPVLLSFWGCGIKTQVKVPVAPKIAAARTATLDELLASLREAGSGITSLRSSSIKVSLTTGRIESGRLEEYRSAPGYILLRRPDSLRLNIQNPITKTTILALVSVGDGFEIWSPRDNKMFVGRNSAREFEVEGGGETPAFTARPIHIFDAVLPQPLSLEAAGRRIFMTEEQDASAKYYVLTVLQETGSPAMRALRRIWIERSELAVVKEEAFNDAGQVSSIVTYARLARYDSHSLPDFIRIDRPLDGYSLDMQFRDWVVNPDLPDASFVLELPPEAQRVVLKEKGKD